MLTYSRAKRCRTRGDRKPCAVSPRPLECRVRARCVPQLRLIITQFAQKFRVISQGNRIIKTVQNS